ncbi:hypothetical protein HZA40_05370, partial [Candidatus Peregrinibacteria bacterium]|nr:hypothetical protein [Candidatus Peregrinibacteria bacterium]
MKVLRISAARKLFVFFFILMGLCGAIFYFLSVKLNFVIDLKSLIIFTGVLLILFVAFAYFFLIRPLNIILEQMEYLLAGKPYKKIYTGRIDEIGVLAH